MAIVKVNNYSLTDQNMTELMQTVDYQRIGYEKVDIYIDTVPYIYQGSIIEINGALYYFNDNTQIDTTDPYTVATVVDGLCYIVLYNNSGVYEAHLTATAPEYDNNKKGYYKAGTNDRYLSDIYINKTGNTYTIIRKEKKLELIAITNSFATYAPTSYTNIGMAKVYDKYGWINESLGRIEFKKQTNVKYVEVIAKSVFEAFSSDSNYGWAKVNEYIRLYKTGSLLSGYEIRLCSDTLTHNENQFHALIMNSINCYNLEEFNNNIFNVGDYLEIQLRRYVTATSNMTYTSSGGSIEVFTKVYEEI